KNHLIVKVPPYHNQAASSSVCVGMYVVTNAGRSHDSQPFTYTPESGKNLLSIAFAAKNDVPVKKETLSPVKTCSFDEQIK
ncbi:unnamed protein product, partial [Tetraodon nigroviridis]